MNRSERKKVATLERRADELRRRIEFYPVSSNALAFDRAELSALEWALGVIADYHADRVGDRASTYERFGGWST